MTDTAPTRPAPAAQRPDVDTVGARPTRLVVAIATTEYVHLSPVDQLPELVDDLDRIKTMLTRPEFGYTHQKLIDPVTGADASLNPSYEQLRSGLRQIMTSTDRAPDDLVVIYYAGHGRLLDDGDYVLASREFDPERPASTGVSGRELSRWLTADSTTANLLLILDTCHSGKASAAFAARVLAQGGAGAIITAARPIQDASPGYLTTALARAVDNPAVAGIGPAALPIDEVVRVINADPDKPGWQTITTNLFGLTHGQPPFLPNPRHQPDWDRLDQLTRNRIVHQDARLRERLSFFDQRARGVHTPDDQAWRFTGRQPRPRTPHPMAHRPRP